MIKITKDGTTHEYTSWREAVMENGGGDTPRNAKACQAYLAKQGFKGFEIGSNSTPRKSKGHKVIEMVLSMATEKDQSEIDRINREIVSLWSPDLSIETVDKISKLKETVETLENPKADKQTVLSIVGKLFDTWEEDKAKEDKAKEDKAKEDKAKEDKAKEDKAKDEKGSK
jgi:hypothetical protein